MTKAVPRCSSSIYSVPMDAMAPRPLAAMLVLVVVCVLGPGARCGVAGLRPAQPTRGARQKARRGQITGRMGGLHCLALLPGSAQGMSR